MGLKRSRIHPKDKTQYRVENWAEYDRALVQRGDITLLAQQRRDQRVVSSRPQATWRAAAIQ